MNSIVNPPQVYGGHSSLCPSVLSLYSGARRINRPLQLPAPSPAPERPKFRETVNEFVEKSKTKVTWDGGGMRRPFLVGIEEGFSRKCIATW